MTKLLCRWFGHNVHSAQSPGIISILSPTHFYWPGAITYCSRCGYAFRNCGGAPTAITKLSIECEWGNPQ